MFAEEIPTLQNAPPSIEELVGDYPQVFSEGILIEFGDKSLEDVRQRLSDIDCNWILEPFGQLRGRGFEFYFQVFEEYARSPDSESDAMFPGQFAMAIELQIIHRPQTALIIEERIRVVCRFIMDNLKRFFDDDDDWAASSLLTFESIFRRLYGQEITTGESSSR